MEVRYILIVASLIIGLGISFLLGGALLAGIFLLLWIDKILIESAKIPRFVGIEFVTLSMIVIGITQGFLLGFVYALIFIPILEGITQLFIPKNNSWPPFVPSISHVADGMMATIAYFLQGSPLFMIFIVALFAKYTINIAKDKFVMTDKPLDMITPIPNFIFVMIFTFYFYSSIELLLFM